jgi:glycerophosphoryl diester phosphodiesterase
MTLFYPLPLLLAFVAQGAIEAQTTRKVELLCHRTASQDVPENTLESLEQAALLGCNVVEIDLRQSLDGEIVLNHDGILERLTDGSGQVEDSFYGDLRLRDAGGWMGQRFANLRIARFEDALLLARKYNIRLTLDIKVKETEPAIMSIVERDGMSAVIQSASENTVWTQSDVSASEIQRIHAEGKIVVANFSNGKQEMDLIAMRAAVAAGADAICVDYPRLGADAVDRPVETKLNGLIVQADSGDSSIRVAAILRLSHYRGFQLEKQFFHWLLDEDNHVSRAAAVALVSVRPQPSFKLFSEAIRSEHASARANAAWALGALDAPANVLSPLLADKDAQVLQETLMALSRTAREVKSLSLLPLLTNQNAGVRGAAALALAHHQPDIAVQAIPSQLNKEVQESKRLSDDYVRRGRPTMSQKEINEVTGHFRCEMKMLHALSTLQGAAATKALEQHALTPNAEFTQMLAQVAAFQLWDRVGSDAEPAVKALASTDSATADRAEWLLVQGGPLVLPAVRRALSSPVAEVRKRAMQIVAWQGDTESLKPLKRMQQENTTDATLAAWAIAKIETMHEDLK